MDIAKITNDETVGTTSPDLTVSPRTASTVKGLGDEEANNRILPYKALVLRLIQITSSVWFQRRRISQWQGWQELVCQGQVDTPEAETWEVTVPEPGSDIQLSVQQAPRGQENTGSFLILIEYLKYGCHVSHLLCSEAGPTGRAFFPEGAPFGRWGWWPLDLPVLARRLREEHSGCQHRFWPPAIAEKDVGQRIATKAKQPLHRSKEDKNKVVNSLSCAGFPSNEQHLLLHSLWGREGYSSELELWLGKIHFVPCKVIHQELASAQHPLLHRCIKGSRVIVLVFNLHDSGKLLTK